MTQNIADIPLNIQRGETRVGGTLSEATWKATFEQKLLTFNIFINHGINDTHMRLASYTNESVEGFAMRHNKFIEFLPVKVADKFPNLIAYSAFNCSVKSIFPDNFYNLSKLEGLGLAYNQIEVINATFFDELIALKVLKLGFNKIKSISKETFKNLVKLEIIFMDDNLLKYLDFDLEPLVELQYFSMTGNQLSILSDHHFEKNKKLEKVWLDNNEICIVAATLFDDLNELKFVDFKNNTCIHSFFSKKNFAAMKEKFKDLK